MTLEAATALTGLARRLIEDAGSSASAAANLASIRAEVERIATAASAQPSRARAMTDDVRAALVAAGLEAIAPPGAPLPALRAALLRLEGHLTAIAQVRVRRG